MLARGGSLQLKASPALWEQGWLMPRAAHHTLWLERHRGWTWHTDKISIQNFKLLQKTTCCCASPWERQEAAAELSIVYNKIIFFSSESEALLKDHTGTRMRHRRQEADLWDFPCEEIAWKGWVSWLFYLKNSSGSVAPQQAGCVTPEQLPLCPHTSLSKHLSLQGHTKSQDSFGELLHSRAAGLVPGVVHSAGPSHSVTGKNRVPLLGFWCPRGAAAQRHGHRAGMQSMCLWVTGTISGWLEQAGCLQAAGDAWKEAHIHGLQALGRGAAAGQGCSNAPQCSHENNSSCTGNATRQIPKQQTNKQNPQTSVFQKTTVLAWRKHSFSWQGLSWCQAATQKAGWCLWWECPSSSSEQPLHSLMPILQSRDESTIHSCSVPKKKKAENSIQKNPTQPNQTPNAKKPPTKSKPLILPGTWQLTASMAFLLGQCE